MSTHRRRLSAVLHADLIGFVRLMEGAEDRTVSHLRSAQDEIWRPAIEAGGGTVVDDVGDSILAEFQSPRAAVAAAIDIQERMAQFNDMLDDDQRLMFRIGLHLGEIIVDEDKHAIFGDGVNVAARLETLCEPGGVCISRAANDQIRDKLSQTNQAVVDIRESKKQLAEYAARLKDDPSQKRVVDAANDLIKRLSAIEQELYQVKNQSSQDPLNYPIKLNNRIASLMGVVTGTDAAPTKQSYTVYEGLASEVNVHLRAADKLLTDDLAAFNKLVRDANIPAVVVKRKAGA